MPYFATFHGSSYAGTYADDVASVEVHASIESARQSLADRYRMGHRYPIGIDYADGRARSLLMPSVGEGDALYLYRTDAAVTVADLARYSDDVADRAREAMAGAATDAVASGTPDVVLEIGPRGGIRRA